MPSNPGLVCRFIEYCIKVEGDGVGVGVNVEEGVIECDGVMLGVAVWEGVCDGV